MESQNFFFEGPEKKLEVVFKNEGLNLLEKEQAFWEQLVSLACAKILSQIHSYSCKAFLLSESSLFVWKDRVILITCGSTQLIKACEFLVQEFSDFVEEIYFERKNEYQPRLQFSSSLEDMSRLCEIYGGKAFRLGRQDDHHVYLYNQTKSENASASLSSQAPQKIKTLELLMYGLRGEFKNIFYNEESKKKSLMDSLKEIFAGYQLDPYFFEPMGFSLNALKGEKYLTIHVTPQGEENYFSFEMDHFEDEDKDIIYKLVELCQPTSFDLIAFEDSQNLPDFNFEKYQIKQKSDLVTDSQYYVFYQHYFDSKESHIPAFELQQDR